MSRSGLERLEEELVAWGGGVSEPSRVSRKWRAQVLGWRGAPCRESADPATGFFLALISQACEAREDWIEPGMPPHRHAQQLAVDLEERLARLTFPVSPTSVAELRATVSQYTDELRSRGVSPEGVIVAVKQIAQGAGYAAPKPSAQSAECRNERDKLLTDLVSWCIDGYYRAAIDGAVSKSRSAT